MLGLKLNRVSEKGPWRCIIDASVNWMIMDSLISPWTKWPPFHRRYFQVHFCEWKILYLDWNSIEICSYGYSWQYFSIGLENGLAPNRRQAIIWTNDDPIHWRIYAALGGDELRYINGVSLVWWQPITLRNDDLPLIARFMGPTWGPSGASRTQVGPMLPHELCYLGTDIWTPQKNNLLTFGSK